MEYLQRFIFPGILVALIAYLLGSLSFSIIFTRVFKGKADIRSMGSGNAGATNVLRCVGKLPAALTFLCDALKCVVSVLLGTELFAYFARVASAPAIDQRYGAYMAGLMCLLGHIFPIFFGFKGGKGVVTSCAMVALLDWRAFLIGAVIFFVVFAAKRIVSLCSVVVFSTYPIVTFLLTFFVDYKWGMNPKWGQVPLSYVVTSTIFAVLIGFVIIIKHRMNLKRLAEGTEEELKV